ncbi:hypothetical protein ABZ543_33915 [Streptomyces roseifaciens]
MKCHAFFGCGKCRKHSATALPTAFAVAGGQQPAAGQEVLQGRHHGREHRLDLVRPHPADGLPQLRKTVRLTARQKPSNIDRE